MTMRMLVLTVLLVAAGTRTGTAEDVPPTTEQPTTKPLAPVSSTVLSPAPVLPAGVPQLPVTLTDEPADVAPSAVPVGTADSDVPAGEEPAAAAPSGRNFAGSVQLDYLAIPTERIGRNIALDGATAELSLKVVADLGHDVSTSAKLCYGCHGVEVGMAYFDLRVADELSFRVGRFTPSFGSFPLRHDPANHRTSDKPLPYDMGRMVRLREWNEGILPAPWVDNGVEIGGAHYFGTKVQLGYAAFAIGGPRGDSEGFDFDFTQSRSPDRYYVDNNSRPALGGRINGNFEVGETTTLAVGASVMAGHYDPAARLGFFIGGVDAVLQLDRVVVRAEYLLRWTEFALGDDPRSRLKYGPDSTGRIADSYLKDGFYAEVEVPVSSRVELVGRFDGLRRFGNVLATSELTSRSTVLRYTAAAAIRVAGAVRIKTSVEAYDFSDFDRELAMHLGLAGSF
ncbi:MAG: hypothetical protein H0T89_18115 [Deltaproteobacteria bacterium]|nr:hypothetical protein [Deltaproteobacteria bacterium]MDQ3299825.1 hypothetical protein [Myxococcota bacterium]